MLTKEKLVQLAQEDSDKVRELAEIRSGEEDSHFHGYLLELGVIYGTSYKNLGERLARVGVEIGDLNLDNKYVVENGWLFPAYDSKGNWLYWINYSHTRDSNKKYLNVMPKQQKDKLVYGLDTFPEAIKHGQLVWVEGVIDQCRLASYGVPTVATIGTYVSEYMKVLSKRVQTNVIIPDNDADGNDSVGRDFGSKLQSQLTNARVTNLSYVKDVDDCYTDIPEQFFWIVDQLTPWEEHSYLEEMFGEDSEEDIEEESSEWENEYDGYEEYNYDDYEQ